MKFMVKESPQNHSSVKVVDLLSKEELKKYKQIKKKMKSEVGEIRETLYRQANKILLNAVQREIRNRKSKKVHNSDTLVNENTVNS